MNKQEIDKINTAREMESLRDNLHKIVSSASPRESIESLLEYLGIIFSCDRIYIFKKDENGFYDCTQEWCAEGIEHRAIRLQGLSWEVVRPYYRYFLRGENIKIKSMDELRESDDKLYDILKSEPLHSLLAGQLTYEGEDLGFIGVDNPDVQKLEEMEIVFKLLGYFAASLLHGQQLISKLEKMGYQDRMTGTGNRHSLFETIDSFVIGEPIALIYCDIVNLKQINDSQGHDAGDAMIVNAARILGMTCGREHVYRMGGDAFLVIFQEREAKNAEIMASRVKSSLKNSNIHVAIGVVKSEAYEGNFSELLHQADRRMYHDKNSNYNEKSASGSAIFGDNAFSEIIEIHPQNDYFRIIYTEHSRFGISEGKFYSIIRSMARFVHEEDQEAFHNFWDMPTIRERFSEAGKDNNLTERFRIQFPDGDLQYLETKLIQFGNLEENPILICFARVLSEKEKNQEKQKQIEKKASKKEEIVTVGGDFFHEVDEWISAISPKYRMTIACDIDNFKLYNEIFGRKSGDEYLSYFSEKMEKIAEEYGGRSSYLGGDNFCMVVALNHDYDEKELIAKINKFIEDIQFRDGFLPSVGICISDKIGEYEAKLYDHATVALNKVKGQFTEHVAVYDDLMYQKQRQTQLLLIDAPRALRYGEFVAYMQPKVEIATGKIVGAEALVRWKREGRIVPPGDFIPAMENSGYVVVLDRFIWEETCRWLNRLAGRGIEPLPVSVNVSRVDLHFLDIAELFTELVHKYAIRPEWIQIEITESAYTENAEKMGESLGKLRKRGFKILMDDFGSGYSSLNMLQDAEIDILKLDRGFLTPKKNMRRGHVIRSAVSMANLLDMEVIAEGVETAEQCEMLKSIGCRQCQGFYFYKPMPIEEFEAIAYAGGAR